MAQKKHCKLSQMAVTKQILRQCSNLGRRQQLGGDHRHEGPCDAPKGHFFVYVGENRAWHVVPIDIVSRPEFLDLLHRAEEFEFDHDMGITIPCNKDTFQSLITSSFS